MSARSGLVALILSAVAANLVPAQARRPLPTPKYTKILQLDSTEIVAPALSPDGRWIVYGAGSGTSRNLWIVPATGGTSRRLTTGDYVDGFPVWFPRGERIVFSSSRVDGALMTIGIDPATGRVTESPRRLTLEGPALHYAVSPDAQWVVYALGPDQNGSRVRILPAGGGTARTLDSLPSGRGAFANPTVTADGRFVQYLRGSQVDEYHEAPGDEKLPKEVMRVSLSGGRPTLVMRGAPGMTLRMSSEVVASLERAGEFVWLQNLSGDTIGVFTLHNGYMADSPPRALAFTSEPNTFLAVTRGRAWRMMVLSVDGGTPRAMQIIEPSGYAGSVLTDGRVVIESRAGDRTAVDLLEPSGALARRVVLPDSASVSYATSDAQLIYWIRGSVRSVLDAATGQSRVISRRYAGSGADYKWFTTSRDEDLYMERAAGGVELRAWSPLTSTSRVLRTVSLPNRAGMAAFTVRGDVIAYAVTFGDSTVVFTAKGATGVAHRIIATPVNHTDGLSLSRDGRRLAVGVSVIHGRDTTEAISITELSPDASVTRAPRLVPVENVNGLSWLPNGGEILYHNITRAGATSLMRLSVEEGARARIISQNERRPFWRFALSSDGKSVLYPAELPNAYAIWRVELPGLAR
jgi:Tol biopolymer transport system component